jgi:hypothetical protein
MRPRDRRLKRKLVNVCAKAWNDKCSIGYTNVCNDDGKRVATFYHTLYSKHFSNKLPLAPPTDVKILTPVLLNVIHHLTRDREDVQSEILPVHQRAIKDHESVYRLLNQRFPPYVLQIIGEYCIDFETGLNLFEYALVYHYHVPLVTNVHQVYPENHNCRSLRTMHDKILQEAISSKSLDKCVEHQFLWKWLREIGGWEWAARLPECNRSWYFKY